MPIIQDLAQLLLETARPTSWLCIGPNTLFMLCWGGGLVIWFVGVHALYRHYDHFFRGGRFFGQTGRHHFRKFLKAGAAFVGFILLGFGVGKIGESWGNCLG